MASSRTDISNKEAEKTQKVRKNSYFDRVVGQSEFLTYSAVYGDLEGADSWDDLVVGNVVVFVWDQLAVDIAHGPQLRNKVVDHGGIGNQGFDRVTH